MVARRLTERLGRLMVAILVVAPAVAVLAGRAADGRGATVMRAAMPETGGWSPGDLRVQTGDTLRLRLISDDVIHGFAIGRDGRPPVEVLPGRATEVALSFDRPGTYTFYCTRWCGPNHWRMRGTIEVTGPGDVSAPAEPAPYLTLGIDLDAPHPADARPAARPAASQGAFVVGTAPEHLRVVGYIRSHSPVAVWRSWRAQASARIPDDALWDGVAWLWRRNTTASELALGAQLYARDCAACHGPEGRGDGVVATAVATSFGGHADAGHAAAGPSDFTRPDILGASPVLLHGKIVRGGMGTGMPSWGAIYTDAEVWAIVWYLYRFQFSYDINGDGL